MSPRLSLTVGPAQTLTSGVLLAYNEKEAKRLEAKEAAGAAQKAASSERKADEKTRAVFARRLYKWLDAEGRKLPSNEEGIRQHQAMVAEYEEQYGPVKANYQRIYDRIRAAAEVSARGKRTTRAYFGKQRSAVNGRSGNWRS